MGVSSRLDVARRSHDALSDFVVNRSEPLGGQVNPAVEGLPGKMNFVAGLENLLLPVKWNVVAEFADNHLGQEPGSGDAAVLEFYQAGGAVNGAKSRFLRWT